MHIANIELLRELLGKEVRYLAKDAVGGLTSSGAAFVGSHLVAIPLQSFGAGRAFDGEFIEISSDWHQTPLGDDFHLFTVRRVAKPADAGERIANPRPEQYPFEDYPHFCGDYLRGRLSRIDVFESCVRSESTDGLEAEEIIYDSHIRFLAGDQAVVLTTEHGTILGEIEIHAGPADRSLARAMDTTHLRISYSLMP